MNSVEVLTADGKPYISSKQYFFFDAQANVVRDVQGLGIIDEEFVGSMGLKICRTDQLRLNRADAVEDAQRHLLSKIEELKDQIRTLEDEKPRDRKTLKFIMASRG
jgi:hypothetical protein